MFGRRMLILVAVLMGLTALAASVSPPPQRQRSDGGAGAPAPAPAPPPVSSAKTIERRLEVGGGPARIRAAVGDTVVLEVAGDAVDTVVIDGLAEMDAMDPASPARFELYADARGSFPIELLDAGRRIGLLTVE